MYKVIITTDIADAEFLRIAKEELKGFADVEQRICHTEEDLIEKLQDADATISIFEPFTERVFSALPKLKFISVSGIGFNWVDTDAAAAHGVGVCNNPRYCVEDVADHAATLICCLCRHIPDYINDVKVHHLWNAPKYKDSVRRMSAMTLGLIGFGNIARMLAKRMQGFGMKVLAYDPYLPEDMFAKFGVSRVTSLDEIYSEADIISLHLHHNAETDKMINAEAFDKMTAKAPIFINVSRGGLVDEDAMIDAINAGKISAAGIDAITSETPDMTTHPLAKMGGNVLLTPHAGYLSVEALHNQKITSSQFVGFFLRGEMDKVPIVNGVKVCKKD